MTERAGLSSFESYQVLPEGPLSQLTLTALPEGEPFGHVPLHQLVVRESPVAEIGPVTKASPSGRGGIERSEMTERAGLASFESYQVLPEGPLSQLTLTALPEGEPFGHVPLHQLVVRESPVAEIGPVTKASPSGGIVQMRLPSGELPKAKHQAMLRGDIERQRDDGEGRSLILCKLSNSVGGPYQSAYADSSPGGRAFWVGSLEATYHRRPMQVSPPTRQGAKKPSPPQQRGCARQGAG